MGPFPSQEPTAPCNAPNKDLKDKDVLFTFEIMTDSQNLEHGKGESISMQKSGFKGYTYANCSQGNFSWGFENLDC